MFLLISCVTAGLGLNILFSEEGKVCPLCANFVESGNFFYNFRVNDPT